MQREEFAMESWKEFGPEIKRLRGANTVRYVADLAGITGGHLSRLENSKSRPTEETIINLSKALNADARKLLALAGYSIEYLNHQIPKIDVQITLPEDAYIEDLPAEVEKVMGDVRETLRRHVLDGNLTELEAQDVIEYAKKSLDMFIEAKIKGKEEGGKKTGEG
jgi:transcriptional regulator with XRE-family HTH domain